MIINILPSGRDTPLHCELEDRALDGEIVSARVRVGVGEADINAGLVDDLVCIRS